MPPAPRANHAMTVLGYRLIIFGGGQVSLVPLLLICCIEDSRCGVVGHVVVTRIGWHLLLRPARA